MNQKKLKEIIALEEGRNERENYYEGSTWNIDKQEGYIRALKNIDRDWDLGLEETKLIKIEIGECLLEAINKIIDKAGNDAGYVIKDAFGIDFTKIVNNKFIELKKPTSRSSFRSYDTFPHWFVDKITINDR